MVTEIPGLKFKWSVGKSLLTLSVLAIIPMNCFAEQLYLAVAVVNWTSNNPGGSGLAPPGVGRNNPVQCFARHCWTGSVRMGTSHCSVVDGERVMGLLLPPKLHNQLH